MNFKLELLNKEDLPIFKKDMQEAFQIGFEENYGKTDGTILPKKDIDESLNTKGSIAYKAVVDNKIVGGAVVVINEETKHNDLHLLYVKYEREINEEGFIGDGGDGMFILQKVMK